MFLEFLYFSTVKAHVVFGAIPIFIDLVDDHYRITVDEQSLDPKSDSYPEPVDKGFVFCFIVCSLLEDLKNIFELFSV
jgi:hypothetical protein